MVVPHSICDVADIPLLDWPVQNHRGQKTGSEPTRHSYWGQIDIIADPKAAHGTMGVKQQHPSATHDLSSGLLVILSSPVSP